MIKIGTALMEHAEELERVKGIAKEVTLDALREAMLAAYKRYAKLNTLEGYECDLTERTGEIAIFQNQEIVATLDQDLIDEGLGHTQITLDEARKLKPDAEVGDVLAFEVTPDDFGRIAVQSAKQVITQRIREAEKDLILKEYELRKGQVTTAIVQRVEGRNVVVNIGKIEAVLPPREQLSDEYYRVGNKLRVFVSDLREQGRVPQIIVSQSHPAMVREVFELEVPEIEDGIIELKSIAREAGHRTKVAVSTNDPSVDPQGACIGSRGSRIQAIVNELKNEKIDIIRWAEDPVEFIVNALAPAKIVNVYLDFSDENKKQALVVVPDDQLSLAIGRSGQNVRLAAQLTGYKLDIKGLSIIETEGLPLHIYEQYYGEAEKSAEAAPTEGTETVEGETVETAEVTETKASTDVVESTETTDTQATESSEEKTEETEVKPEEAPVTEDSSEAPTEEGATTESDEETVKTEPEAEATEEKAEPVES